jgi:hypothetical protein
MDNGCYGIRSSIIWRSKLKQQSKKDFYTDFLWAGSPIATDMIGKRLKISQYTWFVVCVVAVQFVCRLHYGLEIWKLVFVVVVCRRPFINTTSIFDGLQTILGWNSAFKKKNSEDPILDARGNDSQVIFFHCVTSACTFLHVRLCTHVHPGPGHVVPKIVVDSSSGFEFKHKYNTDHACEVCVNWTCELVLNIFWKFSMWCDKLILNLLLLHFALFSQRILHIIIILLQFLAQLTLACQIAIQWRLSV